MTIIAIRNVNHALINLYNLIDNGRFAENTARRGARVMEWPEPVVTEYWFPDQKVLFDARREANPFFHFFESLWIFAGRRDVATLARYLSSIADYSDDGIVFNAAYGYRLRWHFDGTDQITNVMRALQNDKWTRRAFMIIGDPADVDKQTKDVACNVSVFFNVTPLGVLDMTVNNRSNDAIWGAYGANAVQFGSLHQFIAEATGLPLGRYRQWSNNFHYYPDTPVAQRLLGPGVIPTIDDRYAAHRDVFVMPFVTMTESPAHFLQDCEEFFEPKIWSARTRFFRDVVMPMEAAFEEHKQKRTQQAVDLLADSTVDWHVAAREWLQRRLK